MKTAVEGLVEQLPKGDFDYQKIVIAQAIEKEKKQQDDFAIGFADWMICKAEKYNSYLCLIKDYKELLEIYKKTL